jgi:hypothetical protein
MKLRQLPRIEVDSLRAPKVRRQFADAERQRGEHDVLGREETRVGEKQKALEDEDLERPKERRPPRRSSAPRWSPGRSFRLILRVGAGPRSAVCGKACVCGGCHTCQSRQSRVYANAEIAHPGPSAAGLVGTRPGPPARPPGPGRPAGPAGLPLGPSARSGLAADQVGLAPNNSGHPRAERLAPPRPRRGTYREHLHYTGQAPALRRRPWTRPESQRLFPPTYGLGSPRSAPADHSQRQRRRSEALECGHPSLWGDAEGCRELAPAQERFDPGTSGV